MGRPKKINEITVMVEFNPPVEFQEHTKMIIAVTEKGITHVVPVNVPAGLLVAKIGSKVDLNPREENALP